MIREDVIQKIFLMFPAGYGRINFDLIMRKAVKMSVDSSSDYREDM